MENTPGTEKGTPLAEVLQNRKRIHGTADLSKKHVITLCQGDWTFITRDGDLAKRWPPQETFDQQRLTFLRYPLEDRHLGQMGYWYVWDDWVWETKYPSWRHGIRRASSKIMLAIVEAAAPDKASDNAPTACAPAYTSNALSLPSDSTLPAAGLYPMISNVLPNPAAMQLGVAGVAGESPDLYCMCILTNLGIRVIWLYGEVKCQD